MRLGRPHRGTFLLAVASACLLALSCTPEEKHAWLALFFDGVPPLHQAEEAKGGAVAAEPKAVAVAPTPQPEAERVVWYEHTATTDKKTCRTCHDAAASFALVRPPTELCMQCHKDDLTEYPRMHGPVALGHCITCHEPHQSPHEHLVRAKGPALCLGCHEATPEGGTTLGCPRPSDEASCTECHNPHGGAAPYFLASRARDASTAEEAPSQPPPEAREQ